MFLLELIVTGLVVGLVARAIKPGDDSMGLGKTTVMGILGALLAGWYHGELLGGFLASTVGAIVVISAYYAISHRKHRMIHH